MTFDVSMSLKFKYVVNAEAPEVFHVCNVFSLALLCFSVHSHIQTVQVAQLSQRDRAAGWVSYRQKWKTGTGRQYLWTL